MPEVPQKGRVKEVEKRFGFRNADGVVRPQSWCRACRKSIGG